MSMAATFTVSAENRTFRARDRRFVLTVAA
jgi:hypothetical protein